MPEAKPGASRTDLPDLPPEELAKFFLHALALEQRTPRYEHFREELYKTVAAGLATALEDNDDTALPFPFRVLAVCETTLMLAVKAIASAAFAVSPADNELLRLALADLLCEALTADMRKRINMQLLELKEDFRTSCDMKETSP